MIAVVISSLIMTVLDLRVDWSDTYTRLIEIAGMGKGTGFDRWQEMLVSGQSTGAGKAAQLTQIVRLDYSSG